MFNHKKQTFSFYDILQAGNMYNQDIYFWHDGNFGYVSILQFSPIKKYVTRFSHTDHN
jgi:hypothetical protein